MLIACGVTEGMSFHSREDRGDSTVYQKYNNVFVKCMCIYYIWAINILHGKTNFLKVEMLKQEIHEYEFHRGKFDYFTLK